MATTKYDLAKSNGLFTTQHQPYSFRGKLVAAYWRSHTVRDRSIKAMLVNLRARLPNVNAIAIKTNTGDAWLDETITTKPTALDIKSLADVQKWALACAEVKLDCIAWCVVQGRHPQQEVELITSVCNVAGISAVILNVEFGDRYFVGNAEIASFMASEIRIRAPHAHIGLCFDARGRHPQDIFLSSWLPYLNSLHPMVYPETFKRNPILAVNDAFNVLSKYKLPITVWLTGHSLRRKASLLDAVPTVFEHGDRAEGLVLWRYGDDVIKNKEVVAISQIVIPDLTVPSSTVLVRLRMVQLNIRRKLLGLAYKTRFIYLLRYFNR